MKFLTEVERFVNLTERLAPRCRQSKLWRRSRDNVIRQAWWPEMDQPWEDDDEPENVGKLFVEYMKSKGREIEEVEDDEPVFDEDEDKGPSFDEMLRAAGIEPLKRP